MIAPPHKKGPVMNAAWTNFRISGSLKSIFLLKRSIAGRTSILKSSLGWAAIGKNINQQRRNAVEYRSVLLTFIKTVRFFSFPEKARFRTSCTNNYGNLVPS